MTHYIIRSNIHVLARNKNHIKVVPAELLSRQDNRSFFIIFLDKRAIRVYRNITVPSEINALVAISCNEAFPRGHHWRVSIHCSLVGLSGMRKRAEYPTAMERALRMIVVLHSLYRRIHAN